MLTIQRQFSLPNCVLILEGFNPDGTSSPRPLLSTLTRFECHFGNESKTIQGGRELLNLLAEHVHCQAQALLSGIHSKTMAESDPALILRPVDSGNYHLTIAESLLQTIENSSGSTGDLELKLNSVQLFDLVEALDQLMEDQQTLPDLSLKLRPLSKKEAQVSGVGVQRFLPVSMGLASLALVTAISFVMPVPEITKPAAPESETNSENVIETSPALEERDPSAGEPPTSPGSESSEPGPTESSSDSQSSD